jgi:hypothetical protein
MTTTSLDPTRATVFEHALVDEPLLTLEALADAADRLPPGVIEHHLGALPDLLPDGTAPRLDQGPGDVVRGIATNGSWVMLPSLARLPEYEPLLGPAAARFELALRARGERIVAHNLIAFVAAPGACVPVHFDRNHHALLQITGTKHVSTGRFIDDREQQRQLELGLQDRRMNADRMPDDVVDVVLRAGEAVTIPAFMFHWVRGGGEVSIALTCTAATETSIRAAAVHRFNVRARRFGLRPAPPGRRPRVDRAKQRVIDRHDRQAKAGRGD